MTKPKSTIALDDFEHKRALQQLAAMKKRTSNDGAQAALAKIQTWKDERVKEEPPKRIKINPPKLQTKTVVCSVKTGQAFKAYREGLEIQPCEVYKRAGITRDKFNALELGRQSWNESIRRKICNAIYDIVAERHDKELVKSIRA